MNANGRTPGGPLHLSGPQRRAALAKLGLAEGWVLMSVSEMFEMKKCTDGATDENARLNAQTSKLLAISIRNAAIADNALRSARTLLAVLAENSNEPTTRIDSLKEVANIDEALAVLPTAKDGPEKEDDAK